HPGWQYLAKLMRGVNLVCCPSVMARRECFDTLGGFDGRLPFTADWEMWMRIAAFHDVAYLVKPLVRYRRHRGNETWRFLGARELEQSYRAKMLVLEKCGDRIPDASGLKRAVARACWDEAVERALASHREGNDEETYRYLILAAEVREGAPDQQAPGGARLD